MRRLRTYLRQERGLEPDQLYISSYWKQGLGEDQHRVVKWADAETAAGGEGATWNEVDSLYSEILSFGVCFDCDGKRLHWGREGTVCSWQLIWVKQTFTRNSHVGASGPELPLAVYTAKDRNEPISP